MGKRSEKRAGKIETYHRTFRPLLTYRLLNGELKLEKKKTEIMKIRKKCEREIKLLLHFINVYIRKFQNESFNVGKD